MYILFAGDHREFLASFAQNIKGVEAVILANGDLEQVAQDFAPLAASIGYILIDMNHLRLDFRAGLALVQRQYPQARLWALFDGDSPAILRALREMGFAQIISYRDDLARMLLA